ncbi:hypothetical protein PQR46_00950 [Paraburkholderia sediminicola]|uniref:hypothetical protein n=1 Tax=Paraburkholderia sediminicola TaxID=458836 RepID=UPI0038BCA056
MLSAFDCLGHLFRHSPRVPIHLPFVHPVTAQVEAVDTQPLQRLPGYSGRCLPFDHDSVARMIGSMVCEAAQLLDGADDPVALKAEALKLVESMAGALTTDKSRATAARE